MTIRSVGFFWLSLILYLLLDPPSKLEQGFQGIWNRVFWFGAVQLHPRSLLRLQPRRIVCVRVYIFPCLDVGLLFLLFLCPFVGLARGGFVRAVGVLMIGLKRGNHLGALSGLLLFTLGYGSTSHHVVSLFSVKTLTSCCKAAHFLSPIYLIIVACTGFGKHFPISATSFMMASVVYLIDIVNLPFYVISTILGLLPFNH